MLTGIRASATSVAHRPTVGPVQTARKLVIVNGTTESAAMLEATLDGGHYDTVCVASNEQAYSQIKREQPNLVLLCLQSNHVEGFQVLSMLKLDEATCRIPVVTVSTDDQPAPRPAASLADDGESDADETSERFFAPRATIVMN